MSDFRRFNSLFFRWLEVCNRLEPMRNDDQRPIVCVDLNGVLDSYAGWRGPEHWDPPREGAAEFLERLDAEGYRIVIFTTRWPADATAWLAEHGLDRYVSEVTDRKPAAHVFVDDRAVCFRGDFGETFEQIRGFLAHWEQEGT